MTASVGIQDGMSADCFLNHLDIFFSSYTYLHKCKAFICFFAFCVSVFVLRAGRHVPRQLCIVEKAFKVLMGLVQLHSQVLLTCRKRKMVASLVSAIKSAEQTKNCATQPAIVHRALSTQLPAKSVACSQLHILTMSNIFIFQESLKKEIRCLLKWGCASWLLNLKCKLTSFSFWTDHSRNQNTLSRE